MADIELVVVRTFGDHFAADMAKSALEAAGIESAIRADDAGGMRPHMAFSRGVALLVRADDVARAIEVLETPATTEGPET